MNGRYCEILLSPQNDVMTQLLRSKVINSSSAHCINDTTQ